MNREVPIYKLSEKKCQALKEEMGEMNTTDYLIQKFR